MLIFCVSIEKNLVKTRTLGQWQKQLFENGEGAFARRPNKTNLKRQQNAHEKKIGQLEEKLQNRNEVVAELLQEHVQLKKAPLRKLCGDL